MAQQARCWLCKHEVLNLDLPQLCKLLCASIPALGGGSRMSWRDFLAEQSSQWVSSRKSIRFCLNQKVENDR